MQKQLCWNVLKMIKKKKTLTFICVVREPHLDFKSLPFENIA